MRDQISALVDGELDDADAGRLVAQLKTDAGLRRTWDEYQRVGDALRGHCGRDLCAAVKARLDAEPTALAPRRPGRLHSLVWPGLSAAAGFAAVALVVWILAPAPQSQVARTEPVAPVQSGVPAVAASDLDLGVGNYLLAHQRYSPANAMQGVAPYVRTVSSESEQQ